MSSFRLIVILCTITLISSCTETPIPKPSSYYRIDLPVRSYAKWKGDCPFSFKTSSISQLKPSSEGKPCYFNLEYPRFNATLYLSYLPVNGDLKELVDQEYTLREKHNAFSSGVVERLYSNPFKHVNAMIFDVEGVKAATPLQFFITDSTNHFFRGALYFYNTPNNDSLAPVINYIKADIDTLVESFSWE